MKRLIGLLALALSGIALAGCIAGLFFIWIERPSVLQSSVEMLDSLDGTLTLVEEKATRADELVEVIRKTVDPITSRILQLADKIERTPQDEKDLKQIDEQLATRLSQVDSIVEVVQTAAAIMSKTSQLASSVRFPGSRIGAGPPADDDSREHAKSLAKLATKLQALHEGIARLREQRQTQKEAVDIVIRVVRDVDDELENVGDRLQRVRTKATSWRTQVDETRLTLPRWINSAAVIGSVILAWMGLGQFALLRLMWIWIRRKQPAPDSKS